MKDNNHKVSVITGAGSGIGRSLAIRLSQAGAHLASCDILPEGLAETSDLFTPEINVSLHTVDVSNLEQTDQFTQDVLAEHGNVDILINNAGITLTPTIFDQIPDDQFEKIINVNMWGVYNGIRVFLPHLRTRPEAVIVNISSLAGLVGLYGYSQQVCYSWAY